MNRRTNRCQQDRECNQNHLGEGSTIQDNANGSQYEGHGSCHMVAVVSQLRSTHPRARERVETFMTRATNIRIMLVRVLGDVLLVGHGCNLEASQATSGNRNSTTISKFVFPLLLTQGNSQACLPRSHLSSFLANVTPPPTNTLAIANMLSTTIAQSSVANYTTTTKTMVMTSKQTIYIDVHCCDQCYHYDCYQ